MKIIFARHGETVFGKEGRFEGLSDSQLTDKGREQAGKLAKFCKKEKVGKIYSSPLGRASETSNIVSRECGLKIIFLDALKEICYGEWEGMQKSKINPSASSGQKSKIWKKREENLFRFVHSGTFDGHKGESYEQLFNRLKPFFKKMKEKKENSIVISHLGVIRSAKKYFENLSKQEFNNLKISNNHVFIVEVEKNRISCLEKDS